MGTQEQLSTGGGLHVNILSHLFDVAKEPADFWGWVSEGRYDTEFYRLVRELKPEHTFLDLGAWIGSHSLLASTICKRVIAVEPDPVAFQILEANTRGKGIELWQGAITNHSGTIKLGSGLLGASTTRANPNAGGAIGPWVDGQSFDAPCMNLWDFVERFHIEDPLFIKMDVEGSEEQIFEDGRIFEERNPGLLVEAHPFWWENQEATWELLRKFKAA